MATTYTEAEDPEEGTVLSMQEVVEEEENLEATARAVLGPSDDKNCTYPEGYMSRQALYACATCQEQGSGPAGVCLACSLACHDGHDLYELYTKRNFRCDCGNSTFGEDFKCQLQPEKDTVNEKNTYNHNFEGLYCICERPYPDPEDEVEDEMIQCSVCEDWFHSRHLGQPPPLDYEEMVCGDCMRKHSFLRIYEPQSLEEAKLGDEEGVHFSTNGQTCNSDDTEKREETVKDDQSKKEYCVLQDLTKKNDQSFWEKLGPGFFFNNWRRKLCTCTCCEALYKSSNVEFLLSEDDSVAVYEAKSQDGSSTSSTLEQGLTALSQNLSHVQQVEAIHHYKDLSSELKGYLKKFAENGQVVKRRDIEEFFEEMTERKKRKIEEEGQGIPPDSCHF